jgi:hypothetical protein
MTFATRVRTWYGAGLYSEIFLPQKPFRIGHMYITGPPRTLTFPPATRCICKNVNVTELSNWKVVKLIYCSVSAVTHDCTVTIAIS